MCQGSSVGLYYMGPIRLRMSFHIEAPACMQNYAFKKRCQQLLLQEFNAPATVPLVTIIVIQLESGMSDLLAGPDALRLDNP